jgi:hypothetical protein
VDDPFSPEVGEQLDRSGERTSLRQDLAVDLPVAALDRLDLGRRKRSTDLARRGAREKPAAHPDPTVDPPAVDR